ncbi:MAG: transcription termination/antitermination protein NusG, partial [Candidatus Hinthialibacter sp.]
DLHRSKKPEIIYPQDLEIQNSEENWWVAHIKPNQGRKLSRDLRISQIPHFLPLVETIRKTRSGVKRTKIPIFPGYLFFPGEREERRKVLETGRTVRVIDVVDQEKFKMELGQVLQAVQSGMKIDPAKKYKRGTPCRIVDGPGLGMVGKVVRTKKGCSLVLEVETIGQSIVVEVDAAQVEIL